MAVKYMKIAHFHLGGEVLNSSTRYFLDQDNSSHWYLVEVTKRAEWEEWLELDESDPSSWIAPDFAQILGTAPSMVEFENPTL
jgi:hypothetical protein